MSQATQDDVSASRRFGRGQSVWRRSFRRFGAPATNCDCGVFFAAAAPEARSRAIRPRRYGVGGQRFQAPGGTVTMVLRRPSLRIRDRQCLCVRQPRPRRQLYQCRCYTGQTCATELPRLGAQEQLLAGSLADHPHHRGAQIGHADRTRSAVLTTDKIEGCPAAQDPRHEWSSIRLTRTTRDQIMSNTR